MKKKVLELHKSGIKIMPVSVSNRERFVKLLEMKSIPKLTDPSFPEGWVNFYRSDDWSSTAYFNFDSPTTDLAAIPHVKERVK